MDGYAMIVDQFWLLCSGGSVYFYGKFALSVGGLGGCRGCLVLVMLYCRVFWVVLRGLGHLWHVELDYRVIFACM